MNVAHEVNMLVEEIQRLGTESKSVFTQIYPWKIFHNTYFLTLRN